MLYWNRPFADCEVLGSVFLYIPNAAAAAELNVYKIIAPNHMELAVSKLVLRPGPSPESDLDPS